jgi:uncharacterized alkaline shock family protein YloU
MIFVGAITLVILGLGSLVGAVYPSLFLSLGDLIAGPLTYAVEGITGRSVSVIVGVVCLAGVLSLIMGNVRTARRERTVVLQNPLGEVMVSLPAIEDFSRVLKGRIEGLRDIKGRVVYSRRGLKVSARITVLADYSIAEVSQKVQDSIRHYIQNTLGIDQEINPTVVVTKVLSREKPMTPGGKNTTPRSSGEIYLK